VFGHPGQLLIAVGIGLLGFLHKQFGILAGGATGLVFDPGGAEQPGVALELVVALPIRQRIELIEQPEGGGLAFQHCPARIEIEKDRPHPLGRRGPLNALKKRLRLPNPHAQPRHHQPSHPSFR
jgi:hypothetical protein